MEKKIIKEIIYKGHRLTKVEDGFGQEGVIIDGDESKDYMSFADAKRVINGEQPKWVEF